MALHYFTDAGSLCGVWTAEEGAGGGTVADFCKGGRAPWLCGACQKKTDDRSGLQPLGPIYRVQVRKSLQNEYCAAETRSRVVALAAALDAAQMCLDTGGRAIIDVLTCQGEMEPELYRRVVTGFKE